MRAAEHPCVRHPRQLDIAGIASRAGDPLDRIYSGVTPADHAHRIPIRRPVGRPVEDRGHVSVVVRAAADVARHALPDFILGGIRRSGHDGLGRHQLARRAESALRAVAGDEGRLKRIEPAVVGEPFDRLHGAPVGPDGELTAGVDGDAVEMHRARAALAAVAPDLGPRQVEVVANQLGQRPPMLDVDGAPHAIDGQRDGGSRRRIGLAGLRAGPRPGGREGRRRRDGRARLQKRPARDRIHCLIIVERHVGGAPTMSCSSTCSGLKSSTPVGLNPAARAWRRGGRGAGLPADRCTMSSPAQIVSGGAGAAPGSRPRRCR